MKKIKYYKQEEIYTCGPACMRMALEFFGIKVSELKMESLLKTNKKIGTKHGIFPVVAEKFKLNYIIGRSNTSIKNLKELRADGYIIIVCYYHFPEKVDHYAIFNKADKQNVYLIDPWFGPKHKYSINYFRKIWKSVQIIDREKPWFFAMKL